MIGIPDFLLREVPGEGRGRGGRGGGRGGRGGGEEGEGGGEEGEGVEKWWEWRCGRNDEWKNEKINKK